MDRLVGEKLKESRIDDRIAELRRMLRILPGSPTPRSAAPLGEMTPTPTPTPTPVSTPVSTPPTPPTPVPAHGDADMGVELRGEREEGEEREDGSRPRVEVVPISVVNPVERGETDVEVERRSATAGIDASEEAEQSEGTRADDGASEYASAAKVVVEVRPVERAKKGKGPKSPKSEASEEKIETHQVQERKARPKSSARRKADALEQLLGALLAHPRRLALTNAGRTKDQLLRSLIPLYIARELEVDVSSGLTSRFWAKQGVRYAAPNVAKALREHPGHTRKTSAGTRITPVGVKYVETAVAKQAGKVSSS